MSWKLLKLYIGGESYAGVYIPYFAHAMLMHARSPADLKVDLCCTIN